MTWITDNPIPLFILGLFAQIILGILLWQTGRGGVLVAMIGLALVSIGLVVVEVIIVSPTEEIATTLDNLAAALETNQVEDVQAFIAPEATALHREAATQLSRVRIEDAAVTGDLQVTFNGGQDRPTATASFIGRIQGRLVQGASPHEQFVQRFRLHLRKDNDRWLVTGYEIGRR